MGENTFTQAKGLFKRQSKIQTVEKINISKETEVSKSVFHWTILY